MYCTLLQDTVRICFYFCISIQQYTENEDVQRLYSKGETQLLPTFIVIEHLIRSKIHFFNHFLKTTEWRGAEESQHLWFPHPKCYHGWCQRCEWYDEQETVHFHFQAHFFASLSFYFAGPTHLLEAGD